MIRSLLAVLLLVCVTPLVSAQQLRFTAAADDTALTRTMPLLAQQAIDAYHEDDRDKYLGTLFRL